MLTHLRLRGCRSAVGIAAAAVLALLPSAATAASAAPAQPRGNTPTTNLHITERHAGQLRMVASTTIPHTHLPIHVVIHGTGRNASATSGNWSGYADAMCSTCKVRYVAADFSVPSINCSNSGNTTGTYYESQWVGLDGWTSSTVEQTGVAGYCNAGAPVYYAWYEMYPLNPVVFEIESQPGDNVAVNVYWDPVASVYRLSLDDTTEGMGFETGNLTCPSGSQCSNSSAEVISEDPGGAVPAGFFLADYGQANFNTATVTMRNGTRGNLLTTSPPYYTSLAVTMNDPIGGNTMAVPGQLTNDTTSGGVPFSDYTDYWKASS